MTASREPNAPATVAELAELVGGHVVGDATRSIARVASLRGAELDALAPVAPADSEDDVRRCRAGAFVVGSPLDVATSQIVADDPSLAFARIARRLHPRRRATVHSIHPTAVIDPSAKIATPVEIGPRVVVEAGATIGAGSILGAGVVVGEHARIGEGCVLGPVVVVYARVTIGDLDEIGAGVILGADGFGYAPSRTGLQKVPQLGEVRLAPDVEMGALSTVDRAALGSTRIGRGSRVGALAHVAHNSSVGEDSVIFPFGGLAGSTSIGDRVEVGLHVTVFDHLTVVDDVRFESNSVVLTNVTEPGEYAGFPLQPRARWSRTLEALRELPADDRNLRRRPDVR